jgi:hypothetical protein
MNDIYRIELPDGIRVAVQYLTSGVSEIVKSDPPADPVAAGYTQGYVVTVPAEAEVSIVHTKGDFRVVKVSSAETFLLNGPISSPIRS